MLKKLAVVLFALTVVLSLSAGSFGQGEAKQDRISGRIVRSNKDKSTLTVRVQKTGVETTVSYDSSTKWTSQSHGDKKANFIEPSEVKDLDYVVCLGSYDDKGVFHATTISKRLSHSPQ